MSSSSSPAASTELALIWFLNLRRGGGRRLVAAAP
eukprot:CAMPEP_0185167830 /NCGR_PEP_ID=MMETSP1139-20130426/14955_1 /TAXON_ID=298111 /ORGANISM="Pavlova sp., Strain CCMP459" /LENGTH=34 /DNA_ID= /DNA_START= /DNA_END= /DNA_ORIENTATION=